MNYLKRAWYAVIRKPARSIILLIIFFAVANLVLAGLAIQHATSEASTLARQKLGGTLTLSYDMQKAMQDAQSSASTTSNSSQSRRNFNITQTPLTEDMVSAVAKQKNILDYNIIVSTTAMANNFSAVETSATSSSSSSSSGNNQQLNGPEVQQGQQSNTNMVMPDVTITGLRSTELYTDFSQGTSKLVSGSQITPSDSGKKVAMIEKNLASANNLKVGDSIEVKASDSSEVISLKIVGIYQSTSSSSGSDNFGGGRVSMAFREAYNNIYTDYSTALALKNDASSSSTMTIGSSSPQISSAVFYLDDPKNLDTAKAEIKKITSIDWTKFSLDSDDAAYQEMVGPIQKVASFANIVVYMVAIIGAVILALILLLNVKERMYETGVLLSMGESKLKLLLQFTAEMVMIAIVAFGISSFSGGYIAQKIGNNLISSEISSENSSSATQTNANGGGNMGGGNTQFSRLNSVRNSGGVNQNVKAISSINVKITFSEIMQLCLAGLIIILLATIVPAVSIMRYKPKRILTRAG